MKMIEPSPDHDRELAHHDEARTMLDQGEIILIPCTKPPMRVAIGADSALVDSGPVIASAYRLRTWLGLAVIVLVALAGATDEAFDPLIVDPCFSPDIL
jgi:hypothetical protein